MRFSNVLDLEIPVHVAAFCQRRQLEFTAKCNTLTVYSVL